MNPYIAGSLVALIVLFRKSSGSKNKILLNEEDFIINVENTRLLKQAKENARRRFEVLSQTETSLPSSRKYRFATQEWLLNNPNIQYGSDLLFVKKLDSFGEVILYNLLITDDAEKNLSDLNKNSNQILHLIRDEYFKFNLPIASVPSKIKKVKLDKSQLNKLNKLKENAIAKLVTIAPYGTISFLEKNNIPYNLKPKKTKPTNLWKNQSPDQGLMSRTYQSY